MKEELLDIDSLCRELVSSIRDIDVRLDELKKSKMKAVHPRMERLINTRLLLRHSLMELLSTNRNTVFYQIGTSYKDSKREI